VAVGGGAERGGVEVLIMAKLRRVGTTTLVGIIPNVLDVEILCTWYVLDRALAKTQLLEDQASPMSQQQQQ
jgi:hypothetical protein